tara:strand:- start:852 stop:1346 length:495 start_codon:yes stop_codon:yes gene_type:complete
MAYSTIPKVRKDGIITLQDSGGTNTLEISYEEGNFTFDVAKDDQTVIRDRNAIVTIRKGDEQPITGSFSAYMRQFTDPSETGSILDFINKTGAYSGNVSTGSGVPFVEHYCIDIVYKVEATSLESLDHSATLSKAVCTVSFAEGDPSSFSISFTAYGGVTFAEL